MTPSQLKNTTILPTLALLGQEYTNPLAARLLLAIAIQESNLQHRVQVKGPARGLWQFERGGGVIGVLTHPLTRDRARQLHAELLYTADEVYEALADNDTLACGFARLLLWSDPKRLPEDEKPAWDYYYRNWRPGKPHPERWPVSWSLACRTEF